ncbi:MAG: flagellar basal body rod protein FlgB [Lachnospiraceae bacterium]|nr:flagellar basal body rod protein FlgB [Lachnospiraceae bacterium]
MINSNAYDYINILDKAADGAWLRNEAIANNIANVDTPGYKRQDIDFESELRRALKNNRYQTVDEKVDNVILDRLKPGTYRDHEMFSYRLDGNNVDIDTENVELASNQIRYQGLIDSITQEFTNLKAVMK